MEVPAPARRGRRALRRGYVPLSQDAPARRAVREAEDSTDKQVCTHSVVPACGEGAFHRRRARRLGVPSAKRQTVQANWFVCSR